MTPLPHRTLRGTGLTVAAVSLGTWATVADSLTDAVARDVLARAHERGVLLFDHAETYARGEAEQAFGRLVRGLGWDRETYSVCCKVFWGVHGGRPNTRGLSSKHIRDGCDRSLRSLGVDYVEILLCHRPDEAVPLEETVAAMSRLVAAGKVLHWGTSEWEPATIRKACDIADAAGLIAPSVEQRQFNVVVQNRLDADFRALQDERDLGLLTWSPLLYGLLSGRYDEQVPAHGRLGRPDMAWLFDEVFGADHDAGMARVRRINALAREHGLAPVELALRWVLGELRVDSAIVGVSSPGQLDQLLDACAGRRPLDAELLAAVDSIVHEPSPSREALHARA
jgi:aryl-alcohol dehydrogenase-like predicted oxidoreductase